MLALKKRIATTTVAVSSEIHAGLQENTPKDTRFAASQWVPRIGGPVKSTSGSPEAVSFAEARAGAAEVAATYRVERGPIYISNPTAYIGKLNRGSSKQAPAGFVQRTIIRGLRAVTSVIGRGRSRR